MLFGQQVHLRSQAWYGPVKSLGVLVRRHTLHADRPRKLTGRQIRKTTIRSQAQFWTEAERNATRAERAKNRYRAAPVNATTAEGQGVAGETHDPKIWRNLTVADVWTVDGWHLAKQLSDKHPSLYVMKEAYNNSAFVPEGYHIMQAASSIHRQQQYKKVREVGCSTASSIHRQQQYKKVREVGCSTRMFGR